jgi:hypothetical protein
VRIANFLFASTGLSALDVRGDSREAPCFLQRIVQHAPFGFGHSPMGIVKPYVGPIKVMGDYTISPFALSIETYM